MRVHCSAVAALLVLLGACSSSEPEVSHEAYSNDGLTINVVYVCNPDLNGRTRMQVKARSSSNVSLVTTREIDGRLVVDGRTEHTLDAGATYKLEQMEAIDRTSVVHVYREDEEIATATFRSDDHACQEGDADRSSE